jgi:hypothetical protein
MRTRALMVSLALMLSLAAVFSSAQARGASPGRMSGKDIQERWQELRKKGWDKRDMGAALQISKRQPALFDIAVQMKGKVPWGALAESFKVCKGNPELVREFWDYVLKQNFSPKEVAEVIAKFPPNKQQRWLYFKYRAGGAEAMEKRGNRGKKGEEDPKRRPRPDGYSHQEVMKLFEAVRFDVKLVKEYFSLREKGRSPQQAWAKIRTTVRQQKAEEREAARKKKEEEEQRKREQAEARKKLREAAEEKYKKKAEDEGKKKEDKGDIISLDGLSALEDGDTGSEKETDDSPEKKDKASDEQRDTDKKDTGKDHPEKDTERDQPEEDPKEDKPEEEGESAKESTQ